MIDIHNHTLFGVDDGPETIEESMELIRIAASRGVTHVIVTPHFNKRDYHLNQDKVSTNFQLLKEETAKENINIELYLGNEVYMDSVGYASIIDNGFNTLADSNYLLVEFNEIMPPANMAEICYEITVNGYIPVIAHAERYEILYKNSKLLGEILDEGAHLQVNASPIVNKENKERNKFAHYLLKNELVSFAASDVHNNKTRKFHLDEACDAVCKLYGTAYADNIFKQNQMNIINNIKFDSPKLPVAAGKKAAKNQLFNIFFGK